METVNYEYDAYKSFDDSKLVDLILLGDINASFYLICVKYEKNLCRIICDYFKDVHIEFSSSSDSEYWLFRFWKYMDCPTKITGKNQFCNIKYRNNINKWLCKCCIYFLRNYKMIEVYVSDDIKLNIACSDDYSDPKPKKIDSNILKIKMIDYFFNFLCIRDNYIMYSYLYCIEKKNYIVHLDEKIANVLIDCGYSSMSPEYVRKIKNKSIIKANKFFEKKYGDTSQRHFSLLYDIDIGYSCYEEILIERRNRVIVELGINNDFLI